MNRLARIAFTWLLVLPAAAALLSLGGCATRDGVATTASGQTDLVTDSDEPEARRRARLRLELASGYFEQGKTTVALDEVKQALVNDPSYPEAYNLRGLIYLRLNENRVAEENFKRALSLSPRDPDAAHNYGYLLCQEGRINEAIALFGIALSNPTYGARAKTLMAQGLCQMRGGDSASAERTLLRAYELDAANPITGYNLASLLYGRGDYSRAQFYVRRMNASELANAETLWLGIKIERQLGNTEAAEQLSTQLRRRFASSREAAALQRGAFNE